MARSIYSRLHRTFGSIPSLAERQAATQNKVAAVAENLSFPIVVRFGSTAKKVWVSQ